jgi:ankyrin repeat protein
MTPLHCVCISGYSSIVEIIVNQKNVNVKDEDGNTPLHIACLHNHPKVVNVLVTKGADILAVDYRGRTCFHLAAILGHTTIVDSLFTYSVRKEPSLIDKRDPSGMTALHLSVCFVFIGRSSGRGKIAG